MIFASIKETTIKREGQKPMFEKNIIINQPHPFYGGSRIVYRFDNNYGAVQLEHSGTQGIELSVCKFKREDSDEFETDYTTELTSDIFVWLEENEIEPVLEKIANL